MNERLEEKAGAEVKVEVLPENDPNYKGRIGAVGFGLNAEQQEAIADLWDWMKRSLESKIFIGGPVNGYDPSNPLYN
ncbi:MAG TPA: hypothetical protein VMZ91_13715 [Candidatus Paceibacterota bacterium]|nr:hypothetical protein [Candidatus Paceibacterota bacterium]